MNDPVIAVLAGGTSSEREVSLGSGRACAAALARSYATQLLTVDTDALPRGLDPDRHVVFSTLHGTFGEDGGMQRLMDQAGVIYAGCDAASSALTMDKTRSKEVVGARGVRTAPSIVFAADARPDPEAVAAAIGPDLVLKPNNEGSSVGLRLVSGAAELQAALQNLTGGRWIVERRLRGRELSVGVLGGRAMGVVEIRPHSGVYDYASKYTKGSTEYLAPAPLAPDETAEVQRAAETAFAACGCRDYARVDFIFCDGAPFFLEINTLPGMKETSLLPMSARCAGLDFVALVRELVRPAVARFLRSPVPQ
ncbi:MAG TPA: D-alanine--D-alanine ligase [Opitutaceae bacterium]|nr:D-alanine--D-alanine ligase [Opitutaceae bacterium]